MHTDIIIGDQFTTNNNYWVMQVRIIFNFNYNTKFKFGGNFNQSVI